MNQNESTTPADETAANAAVNEGNPNASEQTVAAEVANDDSADTSPSAATEEPVAAAEVEEATGETAAA
jgi:hypothetical protein